MKKINHLGIIVDGNGRWAKERGLSRSEGHKAGAEALRKIILYLAHEKEVNYLSLYVFSTENFARPESEVNYLMDLFVKKFKKDFKTFSKKGIKIVFSGRREPLRQEILDIIDDITLKTNDNQNGILNFCLNYGSHAEIIDACKKIVIDSDNGKINVNKLDEDLFKKYLYNDLPNLDLLIRTGGELRLSNFMLWQAAYAEFYFTKTLFPDFNDKEFEIALEAYNKRDRRFGGINYEKKDN